MNQSGTDYAGPGTPFRGGLFCRTLTLVLAIAVLVPLAACEGGKTVNTEGRGAENRDLSGTRGQEKGSLFGDQGLSLFGDDKPQGDTGGGGIGVNSYLWRASLDTISFMPVAAADPFGGVIITDWHSNTASPDERFKLNVYILGRTLRADGIRVAVFRQVKRGPDWIDADLPGGTETSIEDAILSKARQLRNATLEK